MKDALHNMHMLTRLVVPAALIALLLAGCPIPGGEKKDVVYEWTKVKGSAGWSGRFNHASVVFKDELWGGEVVKVRKTMCGSLELLPSRPLGGKTV